MKKVFTFYCLLILVLTTTGCAVAGGIFKAGMWVGVLGVMAVIGIIIFFVTRGSNKN